jgi:hypothetical protein
MRDVTDDQVEDLTYFPNKPGGVAIPNERPAAG